MLTYDRIQDAQSGLSEIIQSVDSAGGQLISGETGEAVERLQVARIKIDNVIMDINGESKRQKH